MYKWIVTKSGANYKDVEPVIRKAKEKGSKPGEYINVTMYRDRIGIEYPERSVMDILPERQKKKCACEIKKSMINDLYFRAWKETLRGENVGNEQIKSEAQKINDMSENGIILLYIEKVKNEYVF